MNKLPELILGGQRFKLVKGDCGSCALFHMAQSKNVDCVYIMASHDAYSDDCICFHNFGGAWKPVIILKGDK